MQHWQDISKKILPSIITFVEQIFDAPGMGPVKEGAAVNLLQTALTIAASAGQIGMTRANDVVEIQRYVRATYAVMKSEGAFTPLVHKAG